MAKFRIPYFILSIILLIIEVCIALFINDSFIRPWLGDFLVVILIYCLIRSFLNLSVLATAVFVLLFSFSIEGLQYLNIIGRLGLQRYKLARIIIGTSFEWSDLLAYTLGIIFVVLAERVSINGN